MCKLLISKTTPDLYFSRAVVGRCSCEGEYNLEKVRLISCTAVGPSLLIPLLLQYIGDNYRRYLLNINYTLNIIPVNEPYFHPATIVCDVQDVGK